MNRMPIDFTLRDEFLRLDSTRQAWVLMLIGHDLTVSMRGLLYDLQAASERDKRPLMELNELMHGLTAQARNLLGEQSGMTPAESFGQLVERAERAGHERWFEADLRRALARLSV